MDKIIDDLLKKFKQIKKKGWIESNNKGYGSAGLLFEEMFGKKTDRLSIPDYHGIEFKTKYSTRNPYISLFNAAPNSYPLEIDRIRTTYGYRDKDYKEFKVLSIYVDTINSSVISGVYLFKLKVDYENKKVVLVIASRYCDTFDVRTSWSFDYLKEKLFNKLEYLAFINVDRKYAYNKVWFRYNRLRVFKLCNFESFLKTLEKGNIRIGFNASIYKSGEKFGRPYDHGTSFEINEEFLNEVFQLLKEV